MKDNKVIEKIILIVPKTSVQDPIVHEIGHKFNIVTNLLYADIKEGVGGIIVFNVSGEKTDLDKMKDFLFSKNVKVI